MLIEKDLPPLFEKYGTQLEIIAVDLSQMEGSSLYQAAITRFQNANIYFRNLRS